NNFAIQGLYPPASAFKVVPYTLAIEQGIYPRIETVYATKPEAVREQVWARYKGLLDPNDPTDFFADGVLVFPETPPLKDWICRSQSLVQTPEGLICPQGGHGVVDIHSALHRSSNQYFWGVALEIWDGRGGQFSEDLLQQWARELGFGERTGIDLPFEQSGVVPDREWFVFHQNNNTGLVRPEGGWSGGDVMNMVIGQGSLTVTPLQVANAYAALANGGTLWRPRVVDSIRDGENNTIFVNIPSVANQVDIEPGTVESLLDDLNGVITVGTAREAFVGFGESLGRVGGKTGTGQTGQFFPVLDETGQPVRELDEDGNPIPILDEDGNQLLDGDGEPLFAMKEREAYHAWFAGIAPLDDPKYAIVVVVDQGGSGGQVAAPTARRIMQFLMGEKLSPITEGTDSER
ncbi:MAG TPA: penicillin-binding transpeptidase domain-containing protein, partial [Acidimicrobiia bacterium]|nr:penicillin-binding transpeptidase domain-containing protein [Acidimicrobiia bacterium]